MSGLGTRRVGQRPWLLRRGWRSISATRRPNRPILEVPPVRPARARAGHESCTGWSRKMIVADFLFVGLGLLVGVAIVGAALHWTR